MFSTAFKALSPKAANEHLKRGIFLHLCRYLFISMYNKVGAAKAEKKVILWLIKAKKSKF